MKLLMTQLKLCLSRLKHSKKPVVISACYRSMNNSNEKNKQLADQVTKLGNKYKNRHIWIGGDFNLPDIDWSNNTIQSHQDLKELNEQYLEAFELSNLTQIVDFPTRKKSTLDLMLTNRPTFLSKCSPVPGFGDHDTAALVDMFCHSPCHKPIQRKIHYSVMK